MDIRNTTKKYSGLTEDGVFIESDHLDHFKLEELQSFCITEKMTEEEIVKHFGRDYELPKDFKKIKSVGLKHNKNIMEKETQKGFIGGIVLLIFFFGLIFLFILAMVWDVNRRRGVSNAETPEELHTACEKYDLSTFKSIPQKCFPYIDALNIQPD